MNLVMMSEEPSRLKTMKKMRSVGKALSCSSILLIFLLILFVLNRQIIPSYILILMCIVCAFFTIFGCLVVTMTNKKIKKYQESMNLNRIDTISSRFDYLDQRFLMAHPQLFRPPSYEPPPSYDQCVKIEQA